jgi:hypothetical protein
VYYGYRYYNADMGRWLNRDPIAEKGGANVYGFVGNDGVNRIDICGLSFLSTAKDLVASLYNLITWKVIQEWKQLEKDAPLLSAPGLQVSANATILGPIVNIGAGAVFFPETCEFAAYRFVLGVMDPQSYEIEVGKGRRKPLSVLLNVLSNAAIGLEGSIGISTTLATPIGGGRHGPNSWLGYFGNAGGSIGPVGVKVFGSSSWGG